MSPPADRGSARSSAPARSDLAVEYVRGKIVIANLTAFALRRANAETGHRSRACEHAAVRPPSGGSSLISIAAGSGSTTRRSGTSTRREQQLVTDDQRARTPTRLPGTDCVARADPPTRWLGTPLLSTRTWVRFPRGSILASARAVRGRAGRSRDVERDVRIVASAGCGSRW